MNHDPRLRGEMISQLGVCQRVSRKYSQRYPTQNAAARVISQDALFQTSYQLTVDEC